MMSRTVGNGLNCDVLYSELGRTTTLGFLGFLVAGAKRSDISKLASWAFEALLGPELWLIKRTGDDFYSRIDL